MTQNVRVLPMSTIGVQSKTQEAIVFRDVANDIRIVMLNEHILKSYNPEKGAVFVTVATRDVQAYKAPDGEQFVVVAEVNQSGVIQFLWDGRTVQPLKWASLDMNWPAVVTIHTWKSVIIAVDDLPMIGLQPVLVRAAGFEDPVIDQALRSASSNHVVIVGSVDDDMRILDVLVPRYDQQNLPRERGHHQSVPFIQRWPLVRGESTLIDYRKWAKLPEAAQVPWTMTQTTVPPQDQNADWNSDPREILFIQTSYGVRVWQWRELMCLSKHEKGDLFATLVYEPNQRRLTFLGSTRHYPLPEGGSEENSWFYCDVLKQTDELSPETLELSLASPMGAQSARTMGVNTQEKVRGWLDEQHILV